MEELILVLGSSGQLALSFKKICPKNTIFLSSEDLDLTNTDKIFDALSKIAPKYVFNFAAYNKVDKAETDDENFIINSLAVKSIAEYCCKGDLPLVHISTDHVFDGMQGEYKESSKTNPLNKYGSAKLMGEEFIQSICTKYIIIRTAWLYSNTSENFLKKIISQFNKKNSNLMGATDIYGNPTSSDSLALGIYEVYKKINAGKNPWGIYHFANKGKASKYQFVCEINKLLANKLDTKEKTVISKKNVDFALPAPRPYDTSLNVEKFEYEFDFLIPAWKEELSRTIEVL